MKISAQWVLKYFKSTTVAS